MTLNLNPNVNITGIRMKDLQEKHGTWCAKNFADRKPSASRDVVYKTLDLMEVVSKMSHHALKARQGIRGDREHHRVEYRRLLVILRKCVNDAGDASFAPDVDGEDIYVSAFEPLLGAQEELGELISATGHPLRHADRVDAVGDVVLYLLDYCNQVGIDFEDAVRKTATKVHKRDWVSNPVDGEVE